MANKKITELTEETSPQGADLLALVDDVSGTPTTKKVTVTNLMTQAPVQAADISGLATQVSLGNHEALTSAVHGISAFGATLVDDADASAARTTLGLGTAATTDSADYATASQGALADTAIQPSGITNMVETTDSIDVLVDVDTSTVAPTTNDLLKWDGTNFVPGTVSVDVDTPLTTALRGTDNPHIGGFPNQSFKVTDNPYKSVMVIADADGNLEFVTKDGANVFVNTPSARLALAKGFSVQEDGDEPDIEAVTPSGVTYSVISGDSDTKGVNGLPTRQGFNYPDIGANPAPLLISGGSIA
jgi:hypothetical protein